MILHYEVLEPNMALNSEVFVFVQNTSCGLSLLVICTWEPRSWGPCWVPALYRTEDDQAIVKNLFDDVRCHAVFRLSV